MSDEKGAVEKDQRIRVDYTDRKYNCKSYFMLGHLCMDFREMKIEGTCIYVKLRDNLILTGAQNLASHCCWKEKIIKYTDPRVYIARQGYCRWDKLKRPESCRIHPKWNGKPDNGFDIGFFPLWKDGGGRNNEKFQPKQTRKNDVILSFAYPTDIKNGMSVEVAGYPAEKSRNAYTHTGVVRGVQRTRDGGYVIYYDCKTSSGNSGSPIMITDKKFIKDKGVEKVIVGIHTGYDHIKGLRFGTLITPSIYEWILKTYDEGIKPKYFAFLASHEESRFKMDALILKGVLEKCGYNVTISLGDTPDKILKELENFSKIVRNRDVVIFYITTHGANPSNHGGKLKFLFQKQFLDSARLTKRLDKMSASSMLVLVHSCYAGAAIVDGNMRRNDGDIQQSDYMRKLMLMTGKATICAGPPDKVTWGKFFRMQWLTVSSRH